MHLKRRAPCREKTMEPCYGLDRESQDASRMLCRASSPKVTETEDAANRLVSLPLSHGVAPLLPSVIGGANERSRTQL